MPEKRSWYGGENDADDSGVLRYISIRYTGVTCGVTRNYRV